MSDRYIDPALQNTPIMELKRVSLAALLGSGYILKDISFTVFPGDRAAIVGPSGAGKTTLLRLLNRLNESSTGSIYFQNQPINKIPVIKLRQQVVLVPQEPKLLGMTVKVALAYPLVLQQLAKKEIEQRVEIGRAKLHIPEDWLDRTELQLSLGQRQIVAIARAILMQPKILLLDEPTSALDAGSAAHLMEVLTSLETRNETTIIMVNHQLDLAQKFATKILYLENGQLLEYAEANQIDWQDLRHKLIEAEAKAAREWS